MVDEKKLPPREDPETWQRSRWSAIGWGCHCKGVRPCFRDRCRYRDLIECEEHPGDGELCPHEVRLFAFCADGYNRQFWKARDVLGDKAYIDRVRELALIELRMHRVAMRLTWLEKDRYAAARDVDWFNGEIDRLFKYNRTTGNRLLRVLEELEVASLPPKHGLPHIFCVEWALKMVNYGIGPVCIIETREVTFDGVWENVRENRLHERIRRCLDPDRQHDDDREGPSAYDGCGSPWPWHPIR